MPGHPAQFFADSAYGDGSHPAYAKARALDAARAWRDKHWDGIDLNRKLSEKDKYAIRRSTSHYAVVAERYGISPNYVHQIRREDG